MFAALRFSEPKGRNRPRQWLLAALLLWTTALGAQAAGLGFRAEGQPVQELSREALEQALPLKTLTVSNPATAKPVAYQGADLIALLNLGFGERWKSYDLIKFVSADGYQPVIPREVIAAHQGLVAWKEPGRDGMAAFRGAHGETVDPGPYFLVWETREDRAAGTEPWLSWPWQLVAIELTRFDREFPRTAPPEPASEDAKRGFTAFRQHCIKCHQVNGDGAAIGPELNYPVNVTEYWQAEWLPKFIADPQSIRRNSKMVGFYPGIQNREAIIRDIVSYLKAMAGRKIEPKP
jgi:mono/diheme cytochrome c family protein